jgi:hypothetical protein
MEWTKPLSFLVGILVVLLAAGATLEALRTTLTGEYAVASAVALAFVVAVVVATAAAGARSRRWLDNPDTYW